MLIVIWLIVFVILFILSGAETIYLGGYDLGFIGACFLLWVSPLLLAFKIFKLLQLCHKFIDAMESFMKWCTK